MKIMGKALLLTLITGGLTAMLLLIINQPGTQRAVMRLVDVPDGSQTTHKDVSEKNGMEKTTETRSVTNSGQQMVYQSQKDDGQTGTADKKNVTADSRNGRQAVDNSDTAYQKSVPKSVEADDENHGKSEAGRKQSSESGNRQADGADSQHKNRVRQKKEEQKKEEQKKEEQKKEERKKQSTFHKVSENYFSDAVFIGDSRTVGMAESGLLPEAVCYAKVGIGIGGLLSQRFIFQGGRMLTLAQALQERSFRKVYLMIGINDMSAGDTEWFTEKYRQLLELVRTTQPEAVIYIQGNIPMGYDIQDMSGALNNANLKRRNDASRQLADDRDIFYLEIEEIYEDAGGNLNPYFSSDGLHIRPQYYPLWVDYLQHHAIVRET